MKTFKSFTDECIEKIDYAYDPNRSSIDPVRVLVLKELAIKEIDQYWADEFKPNVIVKPNRNGETKYIGRVIDHPTCEDADFKVTIAWFGEGKAYFGQRSTFSITNLNVISTRTKIHLYIDCDRWWTIKLRN